jgi:hypothetical protein
LPFERLSWVDARQREDHHFLRVEDHCLFFGEFHRSRGWEGGETNRLIVDFKRTPSVIAASLVSSSLQYFKHRARWTVARALKRQFGRATVEALLTFVPMPGSKLPGDTDYCDRLSQTLHLAFAGCRHDIRPLLRQKISTVADHVSGGRRLPYRALLDIVEIDPAQLARRLRPIVVLFDDMLTSGKHFAVARERIREAVPGQAILGVFVARRVHPQGEPRIDVSGPASG